MITERQTELHNRSFEHLEGGYVQFCDPFSGEPLRPDRVPVSIESQPWLADGIRYLRERAGTLQVDVLAGSHGDEDYDNPTEVRGIVSSHDAVFLEFIGANDAIAKLFWNVSHGRGTEVSREIVDSLGPHKLRQLKPLASIDKPVHFPEMATDGTEFEKELLEFQAILEELRPRAVGGEEAFMLAVEINLIVATIMREWFMIAKMGSYLKAHDELGERLSHPLIWIGTYHGTTMPTKIRSLGVKCEPLYLEETVANTPPNLLHTGSDYFDFTKAAHDGIARKLRS